MDDDCEGAGCVIGFGNQTLGEEVNITGTPYFLRYSSERQNGRASNNSLKITLSEATVPASLKRIDLTVEVAGQTFKQSFPAQANQTFTYTWDGKDAYGRAMQGRQLAVVTVENVYDGVYEQTARFGYNGNGIPITGDRTRREIMLPRVYRVYVGAFDARALALGGWTMNMHHFYDPAERVLYEGNGARRSVQSVNAIIGTSAGNGGIGYNGDNIPATQASLFSAQGVAVSANGELYIGDTGNNRVRRVDLSGVITTFAGNGNDCIPSTGPCGDGGPATQAQLSSPVCVASGPDGSLYVVDPEVHRIRKIAPNGIITTVAGNGQPCNPSTAPCGDGGPATQASLKDPQYVVVAPDGTIYISDSSNGRVRRVGTDGIITTIAGSGNPPSGGCVNDNLPATQACLGGPFGIVVMPDGSVVFNDVQLNKIYRVGADGIIRVIAGTGVCGSGGDGGPALQAELCRPEGLVRLPDNSLVFCDWNNARVRMIGQDGTIRTIAGTGVLGFSGDGGPATAGQIRQSIGVTAGPDGSIIIADGNNHRIRRVFAPLPGFTNTDIGVPSDDGGELYQFNADGRHLRTINTLTGANKYVFGYDGAGHLTTITDGDNNVTTIQRDGSGNPTGILSLFSQTTAFTLDFNGYLATITNPNNEANQFTYTTGGLLTMKQDPRNNQNAFTYDAGGRLTRDDDPATGFQTLMRAEQAAGYTVTHNTALNRTSLFQVLDLSTGDRQRNNTSPSGLQSTSLERSNGMNTFTDPDGTVTNETLGPDPRWAMQAPLTTNSTISTPGGLVLMRTFARATTLSNPADPLSLVTQTDTLSINGRNYTSAYTASTRTFVNTSPAGRQIITVTDAQGRPTQKQFANLNPGSFTYDSRGRLMTATFGSGIEARSYNFAYNSAGFLSTITDPLNRVTSLVYDLAGRISQKTLPDGGLISFTYDANGNFSSITPPGRPAHSFSYSQLDRLASYNPPAIAGTGPTTYAYNLDRQLTTITRPDGQAISYAYDSAGRLSTLTVPAGQYLYSYNPSTGNLATITAPSGQSLTYGFDGFLPTATTWAGAVSGSISHSFDSSFRIASQSVNSANTVSFTYDNDDLLTAAGSLTLTRLSQSGLISGTTLSNVTDSRSYNNFAELTGYSASFNATALYSATHTRDKLGRITQKTEMIGGVTSVYDYSYDLAGRLIEVKKDGSTISAYTYDSNSNRASYTGPAGTLTGAYDNQDRLTQYGSNTYTYTPNGELAAKTVGGQTTTYQYDALGNLKMVTLPSGTQIEYIIDGQNRRIGKRVNGTLVQGFLYQDQLEPVAELDSTNNLISRFVYASRENVPDYMIKGGATYRIISDHLGSIRLVVNVATGAIAQRIDYDEFGIVTMDTNPGFQPFGYAGGVYDAQTRLVRYGTRDYDAETGRWTAKDPVRFEGGDVNLYGYGLGDPVNLFDRSGQRNSKGDPTYTEYLQGKLTDEQMDAFENDPRHQNDTIDTEIERVLQDIKRLAEEIRQLQEQLKQTTDCEERKRILKRIAKKRHKQAKRQADLVFLIGLQIRTDPNIRKIIDDPLGAASEQLFGGPR